jgi:hypothetical protein
VSSESEGGPEETAFPAEVVGGIVGVGVYHETSDSEVVRCLFALMLTLPKSGTRMVGHFERKDQHSTGLRHEMLQKPAEKTNSST